MPAGSFGLNICVHWPFLARWGDSIDKFCSNTSNIGGTSCKWAKIRFSRQDNPCNVLYISFIIKSNPFCDWGACSLLEEIVQLERINSLKDYGKKEIRSTQGDSWVTERAGVYTVLKRLAFQFLPCLHDFRPARSNMGVFRIPLARWNWNSEPFYKSPRQNSDEWQWL